MSANQNTLEGALSKIGDVQEKVVKRLDAMEQAIAEAGKPVYPYGVPGSFHIRKGESALTSRPYSVMALAKALQKKADQDSGWGNHAKPELALSEELRKSYYNSFTFCGAEGSVLVPLGSALMPTRQTELADGTKCDGLPSDLVAKCADMVRGSTASFDPDHYDHLMSRIAKGLSSFNATSGGTLVGMAAQGELIEVLRGMEVLSRAGATQIDLPPQGKIRFPRQTSSVTAASTSESLTISGSTPGTGALELDAKPYVGMVDISDELMRFSTSVSVEMWLRQELLRELSLKGDRDSIYGAGGQGIQGLVNYSGVRTVLATTVDTNGNTLGPNDLSRLYASIADQNAPVDRGFFYAMTNTLWAGLLGRRADSITAGDQAGLFLFQAASQMLPNGQNLKSISGYPVMTSTQIPTNRAKGSATNLTMVVGGVGAEWVTARAGIIEMTMTNSHASNFATRTNTLRATMYMDGGPRHEESFGLIDSLVNS